MRREILIVIAVIILLTGAPGALWTWETLRPAHAAGARSTTQTAISPFLRLTTWASRKMKDSLEFLVTTGEVRRQNKLLKQQVARLSAENNVLRFHSKKHERLTSGTLVAEQYGWDYVEADVMAYGGRSWINSLALNRGSQDGIAEGDPVLHMRGLAGVVIRVGPWSSTVQLLNNPEAALGVRVPAFGARGLMRGSPRNNKPLTMLLDDPLIEEIPPGYAVESSGAEGSLYPPGLSIGQVGAWSKNRFGQIVFEVEPTVNFYRIEEVLVLKSRQGPLPFNRPPAPLAIQKAPESEAAQTSTTAPASASTATTATAPGDATKAATE